MFSYKFAVYFQNTFYQEHLWTAASERSLDDHLSNLSLMTLTIMQLLVLVTWQQHEDELEENLILETHFDGATVKKQIECFID